VVGGEKKNFFTPFLRKIFKEKSKKEEGNE